MSTIVAAAPNHTYSRESVARAVATLLDHLDPSLPRLIGRGDRVVVKVNLGCRGLRTPDERHSSHPALVEAILRAILDCGAQVTFGDDVSRLANPEPLWDSTGMIGVARRTGASLIDFVSGGGREVRGFLPYPRTHFIAKVVLDADVIVNVANCRSLSLVVMSGAVKNMFGTALGHLRRDRLHGLFPDGRSFSRALVDVCRVVRPRVSFLDLTSVVEGHSVRPAVQPVGLILAGSDPVALDAVAAHAIGYDDLTVWTTVHGHSTGLGCGDRSRIRIRGFDGEIPVRRLRPPAPPRRIRESVYGRAMSVLTHTVVAPRALLDSEVCTACGACVSRCPAGAITANGHGVTVDRLLCADCGACLAVCESKAIRFGYDGAAMVVRGLKRIFVPGSQGP